MGILDQLGINVTVLASIIQFIILSCVLVIPTVGLYFIVRIAVRHGLKDVQTDNSRNKKD